MPHVTFARFFALSAVAAILGVGVWPLALSGLEPAGRIAAAAPALHGVELVFGYLSAVLAGFLLAALPRWTGVETGPSARAALLLVWLAAQAGLLGFGAGAPVSGVFPSLLALWATVRISRDGGPRDWSVAALLDLYAIGGLLTAFSDALRDLGLRTGVAAATGLVVLIGGRIIPALTQRVAHCDPPQAQPAWRAAVAGATAICTGAALACWIAGADGKTSSTLAVFATVLQAARLAAWSHRSVLREPSVLMLYLGYAFIPLGLALMAAGAPPGAILHAWAAGACGLMTLGIMSSVLRKRAGMAFRTSAAWNALFIAVTGAACARLAAAFAGDPTIWILAAAAAWAAAFTLFLLEFRPFLFRRRKI